MPEDAVPPARLRDTLSALAIGVVWSFFAVFCVMMATSEDFTRNARVGFYFGAAVCSLFGVLGLGRWLHELAGVFVGISDGDKQVNPNDIAHTDMRGSEEREDASLELRDDPGDNLLEIRHGDTDAAEKQDADEPLSDRDEVHEEFGLFLVVMNVLEFVPVAVYLVLGIPLLVLFVLGTAKAVTTWTGLAEPRDLESDPFRHVVFVGMLFLTLFFLLERPLLPRDRWRKPAAECRNPSLLVRNQSVSRMYVAGISGSFDLCYRLPGRALVTLGNVPHSCLATSLIWIAFGRSHRVHETSATYQVR